MAENNYNILYEIKIFDEKKKTIINANYVYLIKQKNL